MWILIILISIFMVDYINILKSLIRFTTIMKFKFFILSFLGSFFILASFPNLKAQENPYEMKIGHPRIIMTKYDELALRFILMEDPLAEKLKNELKKDANKLLSCKDIKYNLDRRNTMLSTSREYLKRVITLSLAYRYLKMINILIKP